MGGHYGSVQVRSENRERVKAVAEQIARANNIHCLLAPAIKGWIGIFPENNGQDENIGRQIAQQLADDVLHLLVHDDDIFAYWFFRNGEEIDSYWSAPGYFGEENRAREEAMAGRPEVFRPIVGDRVSRLPPLLARDKSMTAFASERLSEFAEVLGIENVVTAYEYLKEGDASGVKQRRKFKEVPSDRISTERLARNRDRNQIKAERQRLKSAGVLLLYFERKQQIAYGCAMGSGFVVAWPDHVRGSVIFNLYAEPWDSPRPLNLDIPSHITALATDASRRLLAMAAGDRVRIWDVTGDPWKHVADIPESDLAIGAAVSADGSLVAHASRREIAITDISSGKRILTVPNSAQRMAFHPSGEWLGVAANSLGLIALHEPPNWREIFVGGKSTLAAAVGALFQAKMRDIDLAAVDKEQHAAMESAHKAIEAMVGRAKGAAKFTGERLDAMRAKMEASLKETTAHLAQLKDGGARAIPPQAQERVFHVGFSRDGSFFWCGTDRGLRVYDWWSFPRDAGAATPAPRWKFDPPPASWIASQYIYAAAEEADAPALVFAGVNGCVYRLDLLTGETRELLKLPDAPGIFGLALAADGKALALATQTFPSPTRPRSFKDQRFTWQVWSYPKLRGPIVGGQ